MKRHNSQNNRSWDGGWGDYWGKPTATYYFDPLHGNDSANGLSITTAWKSQSKAEALALNPGESILKKIDGEWIVFRACSATTNPGKVVYGYYQDGSPFIPEVVDPAAVTAGTLGWDAAIQWNSLTHIAHDHLEPSMTGGFDIDLPDPNGVLPNQNQYKMTLTQAQRIINKAHTNGVLCTCVIADIVGTFDGVTRKVDGTPVYQKGFTVSATTYMETFIARIVDHILTWGYDGVDIDWENGNTADRTYQFMANLYPALKALNPNFCVTMAAGSNPATYLPCVPYVDMMGVMCYGVWFLASGVVWINAPLYDGNLFNRWGVALQSTSQLVRSFLQMGIPREKIFAGMPFYGTWTYGDFQTDTRGPLRPRQQYSYMTFGLTSGQTYRVRLHFAEWTATAAGQRVFHVEINGTRVLSSFDIYAAAGGRNKAVMREFSCTIPDNYDQVYVECIAVTGQPVLNGIELLDVQNPVQINCGGNHVSSGAGTPPDPVTSAVLSFNPNSQIGGVLSTGTVTLPGPLTVTLSSNNSAAVVPSSVTIASGATSASFSITTSSVSVNTAVTITATYTGGPASATLVLTPPDFVADAYYYGPMPTFNASFGTSASTASTISTTGVTNAAPASVYQTQRVGAGFTYVLPGWHSQYMPYQGVMLGQPAAYLAPAKCPALGLYDAPSEHWDKESLTPYLSVTNSDPTLNSFCSYDDPASITANTQWALDKGLQGVSIWEVSIGWIHGRNGIAATPLGEAIRGAMRPVQKAGTTPTIPGGLFSYNVTSSAATIHWPVIANATHYKIYRQTSGGAWTLLATQSFPGYTDSGLSAGTAYGYAVSAVNWGVESAKSATLPVTAAVFAAPTNLVTAPTNLTNVAWSLYDPTGDAVVTATRVHTASTGITDVSQTIMGLAPNTEYIASITLTNRSNIWGWGTLGLTSANSGGFSDYTSTAGFNSFAGHHLDFNTPVVLQLTVTTDAAGTYPGAIVALSFPDGVVSANIDISEVSFVATHGNYLPAPPQNVTISTPAPSNVYNHYSTTLNWAWSAGAQFYNIWRSVGDNGTYFTLIGNSTGTSYTDTSINPNAHWYYAVTSVHDVNESLRSSVVSVHTPTTYLPPNALVHANDLTAAEWIFGNTTSGTDSTVFPIDAQTVSLSTDTTVSSTITQEGFAVEPNTNYVASATVLLPTVSAWCTLTVWDRTYTYQMAHFGQWVQAGQGTSWRLSFNTAAPDGTGISSLVFSFEIGNQAAASTAVITDCNVAVNLPEVPVNLLVSPSNIQSPVWTLAGTALDGSRLQASSNTIQQPSFSQTQIVCLPNTDYIATATIEREDTSFDAYTNFAVLSVYGAGYTPNLGMVVNAVNPGAPSDLFVAFNSGDSTRILLAGLVNRSAEPSGVAAVYKLSKLSIVYNAYANADEVPVTSLSVVVLATIATSPVQLTGGSSTLLTVQLTGPAPVGGAVIVLSSDSVSAVVPGSVTIPVGGSSLSFNLPTTAVSSNTTATISASYQGVTRTTTLGINAPVLVSGFLNPTGIVSAEAFGVATVIATSPVVSLSSVGLGFSSVVGGITVTGTIFLSGPATSSVTVALSSNSLSATVPSSATVLAGSSTATFTVTTNTVSVSTAVVITATYSGSSRTAALTLTPATSLSSVTVTDSFVIGGATNTTGTVTLNANAPTGGTVVSLASNLAAAGVPSTVTVAAGLKTANFAITSTTLTATSSATITASTPAGSKTATLKVCSASAQAVQIYGDMGNSEAFPEGFPWSTSGGSLSEGNTPPVSNGVSWKAAIAWGVAYIPARNMDGTGSLGNPSTNSRVNIRNMQIWFLSKATHTWTRLLLVNGSNIQAAAYYEDFANDFSKTADVRTESDGTISFGSVGQGSYAGFNVHFYPSSRVQFTPSDVGGWLSMFEARIIRSSASATDDTPNATLVVEAGADYWQTLTSPMPAGSTFEPAIGGGRFKYAPKPSAPGGTASWRSICFTTCTQATLTTYPPPLDLSGDLP